MKKKPFGLPVFFTLHFTPVQCQNIAIKKQDKKENCKRRLVREKEREREINQEHSLSKRHACPSSRPLNAKLVENLFAGPLLFCWYTVFCLARSMEMHLVAVFLPFHCDRLPSFLSPQTSEPLILYDESKKPRKMNPYPSRFRCAFRTRPELGLLDLQSTAILGSRVCSPSEQGVLSAHTILRVHAHQIAWLPVHDDSSRGLEAGPGLCSRHLLPLLHM